MVNRTGRKRHRVQVQSYTQSRGTQGSVTRSWATDNTWWADIVPMSGLEKEQADQQKAVYTHKVYMRFYEPGISPKNRLVFGTRIFNITSVVNVGERGCDTILMVKEVENPS